jgi:hypothetical protein
MLVASSFLAAEPAPQAAAQAVRGDPIPGEAEYRVELGLEPTSGNVLELLIYRGQKQVQALKVCTPAPVLRESPVGSIYYSDYNFDGHAISHWRRPSTKAMLPIVSGSSIQRPSVS